MKIKDTRTANLKPLDGKIGHANYAKLLGAHLLYAQIRCITSQAIDLHELLHHSKPLIC